MYSNRLRRMKTYSRGPRCCIRIYNISEQQLFMTMIEFNRKLTKVHVSPAL